MTRLGRKQLELLRFVGPTAARKRARSSKP